MTARMLRPGDRFDSRGGSGDYTILGVTVSDRYVEVEVEDDVSGRRSRRWFDPDQEVPHEPGPAHGRTG